MTNVIEPIAVRVVDFDQIKTGLPRLSHRM